MKYLLNGVAVAAALAIAAPVWAQAPQGGAPMSPAKPAAPAPAAAAPAPAAKAMPMAAKKTMKRKPMRMAKRGKRMMSSDDKMTDELNRQELARLQGGGAAPMGQPMMAPGGAGQGGPRPSGH